MDQRKLVDIIKQHPPLWDRSNPYFRDKEYKEKLWRDVGLVIGFPGEACRDAFKSLREKYIREREKSFTYGEGYRPWDLLNELKFLDPYILPRKTSVHSEDSQRVEEFRQTLSVENSVDGVPPDFDKALVNLVRKTTPIWDRSCNTYPNKHMRDELWQMIAHTLNRDANTCMLRWKALREKYIRQKAKYQEGDTKWELLDDMSFLDKVIMYRKKHSDYIFRGDENNQGNYHFNESSQQYEYMPSHLEGCEDTSFTDSSSDYVPGIKQEKGAVLQVADSSYNADRACYLGRKRSGSVNSEVSVDKVARSNNEDPVSVHNMRTESDVKGLKGEKTPEELFGQLVAAMLSKKPEKDRSLYMIEIMTVLSR